MHQRDDTYGTTMALCLGFPGAWIAGAFALQAAIGIEFLLAFVLALNGLVCLFTLLSGVILFYDYCANNNKTDSLKLAWILVSWTPVSIAGYFLFELLTDKEQIFNLLVGTSVSYVCFVFTMYAICKCIWMIKGNEIQVRGNVVVPPAQTIVIDAEPTTKEQEPLPNASPPEDRL
jgi:hypothetical protein